MKTGIFFAAPLLFLAVATAKAPAVEYYAAGAGLVQVTNNGGFDLGLYADEQSYALYLTGQDGSTVALPNGGTVTIQLAEGEWQLYGDVSEPLPVAVHAGFTTSLQLAQAAYGGSIGLMGTVDDGRYHRSAIVLGSVAQPVIVDGSPSPVYVEQPGYYYEYDKPSLGASIVTGVVSGILGSIFDDDDDYYHHRPPPRPPHRPPPPPGYPHPPGRPPEGRPPHGRPPEGRPPHDRPPQGRPPEGRPPSRPEHRPGRPQQEARPRPRPNQPPQQPHREPPRHRR